MKNYLRTILGDGDLQNIHRHCNRTLQAIHQSELVTGALRNSRLQQLLPLGLEMDFAEQDLEIFALFLLLSLSHALDCFTLSTHSNFIPFLNPIGGSGWKDKEGTGTESVSAK